MANLDPEQPLYAGIISPAKALLTEAEKAYTAGDFPTAMAKYTAAAEADPHLYEAPLYAGDTAYVQKDLNTAAPWFARAIGIDPNRETAYRYWGDAILKLGNDPAAAREKFIDAIVAEPYSKSHGRVCGNGRILRRRRCWLRRSTGPPVRGRREEAG